LVKAGSVAAGFLTAPVSATALGYNGNRVVVASARSYQTFSRAAELDALAAAYADTPTLHVMLSASTWADFDRNTYRRGRQLSGPSGLGCGSLCLQPLFQPSLNAA
jgi:hypothetical protein